MVGWLVDCCWRCRRRRRRRREKMGNKCSSVDHISLTAQIPLPNFHLSSSGQGSDNSIASYSSASTPSSSVASPSSPWAAYNRLGDCGHSPSFHLHSFSFNDLKLATRNFHPGNFLGEGGFGSVYKGWIHENEFIASGPGHGRAIAVKRLRQGSLQGHKEWLTEVHILGQLHHPNLVKLVGFCADDDHRMLVYEFMSRGSLENHLFQKGATISWEIRMKVIVGAARGLAFLHEAGIIYRDFKTSNILLDSEFNAKLSDFGLAKDGPTGDDTHISTCVMGTRGYAAPEYVATGHLTLKSDVYGFGVVLLEILTGRRVMDRNLPNAEQNLLHWARPYLRDKRKTHRLIDRRLEEGQCSSKGLIWIANLAIHCLQPEAKLRPDMSELLQALEPLVAPKDTGDRYLRRRSMERSIKRHRHGRPMYGDNKAISLET